MSLHSLLQLHSFSPSNDVNKTNLELDLMHFFSSLTKCSVPISYLDPAPWFISSPGLYLPAPYLSNASFTFICCAL